MVPSNNKQKVFIGIPWNMECTNIADTSSSVEFYGPWRAPISLSRAVPCRIPLNLECANFADTSSSVEFHGTSSTPISLTRAVPWNSMELRVRQFRWHELLHEIPWIPWNSMEFGVRQFRWYEQIHGITVPDDWSGVEGGGWLSLEASCVSAMFQNATEEYGVMISVKYDIGAVCIGSRWYKSWILFILILIKASQRVLHILTCSWYYYVVSGDKTLEAFQWMQSHSRKVGDRMPDTNAIHLPSSLSKISVYAMYVLDVDEPLSDTQFRLIWKEKFSNVKIPRYEQIYSSALNRILYSKSWQSLCLFF